MNSEPIKLHRQCLVVHEQDLGTAWAVMQFHSSPILGALSDRFGRRPVISVSLSSRSRESHFSA